MTENEYLHSVWDKTINELRELDSFTIEELKNHYNPEDFENTIMLVEHLIKIKVLKMDEDNLISWTKGF